METGTVVSTTSLVGKIEIEKVSEYKINLPSVEEVYRGRSLAEINITVRCKVCGYSLEVGGGYFVERDYWNKEYIKANPYSYYMGESYIHGLGYYEEEIEDRIKELVEETGSSDVDELVEKICIEGLKSIGKLPLSFEDEVVKLWKIKAKRFYAIEEDLCWNPFFFIEEIYKKAAKERRNDFDYEFNSLDDDIEEEYKRELCRVRAGDFEDNLKVYPLEVYVKLDPKRAEQEGLYGSVVVVSEFEIHGMRNKCKSIWHVYKEDGELVEDAWGHTLEESVGYPGDELDLLKSFGAGSLEEVKERISRISAAEAIGRELDCPGEVKKAWNELARVLGVGECGSLEEETSKVFEEMKRRGREKEVYTIDLYHSKE